MADTDAVEDTDTAVDTLATTTTCVDTSSSSPAAGKVSSMTPATTIQYSTRAPETGGCDLRTPVAYTYGPKAAGREKSALHVTQQTSWPNSWSQQLALLDS